VKVKPKFKKGDLVLHKTFKMHGVVINYQPAQAKRYPVYADKYLIHWIERRPTNEWDDELQLLSDCDEKY